MSDEGFIQFMGRTAWGRYSLDAIWGMVAHEDGTVTAAQVQSWRRMADLCNDQANALEQAIAQLFHRWPPRPRSSAAAFRDRMQDLISSMRDSADHAASMPDPLWKITNQLTMTRYDILELLQQRAATEEIERSQDATHGYNGKAGGRPEPEALPTNWRDQFDQKARQIMAATEAVVTQAAAHIKSPAPYAPQGQRDPGQPTQVDGSGLGGHPGGTPFQWRLTTSTTGGIPIPGRLPGPEVAGDPILAGSTPPPASPVTVRGPDGSLGQGRPPSIDVPLGTILPGAAVGGLPGANTRTTIGSPATIGGSSSGTSRNPASQGPVVAPMGSRTAAPGPIGGAVRPSGRRRFRKDDDEPWGGRSGVPPVIEPLPEPTHHDPGPGVIGIDR